MKYSTYLISILILILFTSFEYNNRMTKSELLAKQGVLAVMPSDFEYDFKYKVVSYDWAFKGKQQDIVIGNAKGSYFPEPLIQLIKSAKSNDVLVVENVKVIGVDNYIRRINGITVVIK